MHYLNINEIRSISIDQTSKCNLRCPQCARTNNITLPSDELTISDYKSMIQPVIKNLNRLYYCGNFGDAIVSNTLIPSLTWVYNESGFNGTIGIVTNGSARNINWWIDLAKLMDGRGTVSFSIDGLADTNHLYRVNSNFEKIMENATAFINAGGKAEWHFLVFKHNEHQIDDAIKLAKDMNFNSFTLKQTNRFVSEARLNANSKIVRTNKGEHIIEMTSKSEYRGSGKTEFSSIIDRHGSWNNYINATNISCKMKANGSIFVDFEARVWACTWTSGGIYYDSPNHPQHNDAIKILNTYGWNFNSLRHHTLEEILSHEYYSKKLCESWNGTISDPIPKLQVCGKMCGTDLEYSSGWTDSNGKSNKNNQTINLK